MTAARGFASRCCEQPKRHLLNGHYRVVTRTDTGSLLVAAAAERVFGALGDPEALMM